MSDKLYACQQRAIELYYQHRDDTEVTCGELRQQLEKEYGTKTVKAMLEVGIGNHIPPVKNEVNARLDRLEKHVFGLSDNIALGPATEDIAQTVNDMRTQADSEALNEAKSLIDEIMRGEVNPEDEAEKWLRAFAPEYLRPNAQEDIPDQTAPAGSLCGPDKYHNTSTHGGSGLDTSTCSRVVASSRLEDLAEDLERWANARIEEQKVAIKQYRQKPYHRDNYFCACGQLDAADRIRDLIRNESFSENA